MRLFGLLGFDQVLDMRPFVLDGTELRAFNTGVHCRRGKIMRGEGILAYDTGNKRDPGELPRSWSVWSASI